MWTDKTVTNGMLHTTTDERLESPYSRADQITSPIKELGFSAKYLLYQYPDEGHSLPVQNVDLTGRAELFLAKRFGRLAGADVRPE